MKNKLPKTKLEIELSRDKIVLQQRIKKLQTLLQAVLNALDEIINERK